MCFNQDGVFFSLNDTLLKLVDQIINFACNISSTESDVNICIVKAWTATDRLTTMWKHSFSNKIKRELFQALAVSVLLYGCTT